jgi:hypothetical protein
VLDKWDSTPGTSSSSSPTMTSGRNAESIWPPVRWAPESCRSKLLTSGLLHKMVDRDSVVAKGRIIRGSNPGVGQIFRTRPDQPWGSPSPLQTGCCVPFSGVKRPGCSVDRYTPSSASVKEKIGLRLYTSSGPS